MKALVTGVAGFIGSALARQLLWDGWDVVGIDSLTDYYSRELKEKNLRGLVSPHFQFVHGDLNEVDLPSTLRDVEAVFHLAGQPGVRGSWGSNFAVYTQNNIGATQKLLEAARGARSLRRFVYSSSSSVYGEASTFPTKETDRPQPVSPYGVSKLAAEHLTTLYAHNFEVPAVSLRYFTVYGPGQRPDMAFTRFTKAAYTGAPIRIYGTGKQIRDFTFVSDVVQANLSALGPDVPPGVVLNVAGGSSTSVNEVLQLIEQISGRPLNVEYEDAVAGDVSQTGGDTTNILAMTGWRPTVSLSDGLSAHLEWAKSMSHV